MSLIGNNISTLSIKEDTVQEAFERGLRTPSRLDTASSHNRPRTALSDSLSAERGRSANTPRVDRLNSVGNTVSFAVDDSYLVHDASVDDWKHDLFYHPQVLTYLQFLYILIKFSCTKRISKIKENAEKVTQNQ